MVTALEGAVIVLLEESALDEEATTPMRWPTACCPRWAVGWVRIRSTASRT